jgi:hypothetical protein
VVFYPLLAIKVHTNDPQRPQVRVGQDVLLRRPAYDGAGARHLEGVHELACRDVVDIDGVAFFLACEGRVSLAGPGVSSWQDPVRCVSGELTFIAATAEVHAVPSEACRGDRR